MEKMPYNFKDLTGQHFGRLEVLSIAERGSKTKKLTWNCKCDCGNNHITAGIYLTSGHTKSCGCFMRDNASQVHTTHGLSRTKIHRIWAHIIQRCTNVNRKDYKHYGGRGITVCDEWRKFENFYKDMGDVPKGLEIDRIDNEKGYFKENCRWTTRKENCRNTRKNKLITFQGETLALKAWAEKFNLDEALIRYRLRSGWSTKNALTARPYTVRHENIKDCFKGSKQSKVLEYMKVHKKITLEQIKTIVKTSSPVSMIYRLRQKGCDIASQMIKDGGKRYKRYEILSWPVKL